MWWNGFGPAPWMLFGPLLIVVMMAACVVMMYFMMRDRHSDRDAAAHILQERFARGEIGQAEYEERRRTLES